MWIYVNITRLYVTYRSYCYKLQINLSFTYMNYNIIHFQ